MFKSKILAMLCSILGLPIAGLPGMAGDAPDLQPLARSCNAFGFKLLGETRKSLPDANIFQSPAGLAFALSMLQNGARGETRNQIAQILQEENISTEAWNAAIQSLLGRLAALDPKIKLEIANGIWTARGADIKPGFLSGAEKFHGAQAASADFQDPATVKSINDWVSKNTHGKISDFVAPPLERDLRLILLDAIYFKGAWEVPFDKKLTEEKPFTLAGGQAVSQPGMSRSAKLGHLQTDAFQAVELPYAGREVSLFVFLPTADLGQFLGSLTPENWGQWMAQFRPRQGKLQLPRFKLENEYDLKNELKSLGMMRAFTRQAEFGGISDEELSVSWVRQKTFVELNEEGIEAAAVTGVGMRASAVLRGLEPPFSMIVDRPFYLAIRENQTGLILFQGAILDPR
jgi:serpin B